MFDPYNKTFSWRAHRIGFVLNQRWKPSRALTSLCKVASDDTGSSITITALKSPFYGPENQSTSAVASLSNDITIIVGDVNRSVEESSFPRWWTVSEPRFFIQFTMVPALHDIHPFWVLLEDDRTYLFLSILSLSLSPHPTPIY